MRAVIFAGPSLYGLRLDGQPGVIMRPPAAQGDIYRACLLRPQVIGLIDGYFEGVASVWHKEILWALSQGVMIFGSASMGALRAAELDAFGMIGVGRIYACYRDGSLEDDDEVALLHGPAETGYLPLSEPMVNIRETCRSAVEAGVLDTSAAEVIVAAAKAKHYKNRAWQPVLEQARGEGVCADTCARFAAWLSTGRVDQKQLDAVALIDAVLTALDRPARTRPPGFRLQWTDLWDRAMREWNDLGPPAAGPGDVPLSAVIDELRLEPERYRAVRSEAVMRALVLREARVFRGAIEHRAKRECLARLRERLGLLHKSDLDAWVKRNGLDDQKLDMLLEEEALIEAASQLSPSVLERQIASLLHLSDAYAQLYTRARRKCDKLEATGIDDIPIADPRLPPPLLVNWYFREKMQTDPPQNMDEFIYSLDITSRQRFYRLIAAEYVYCHVEASG